MFQRQRSEAERALPEWMRDSMDRARMGINPQTNQPMSKRDAVAYVNAFLPPYDPGRLFDADAHEIDRYRRNDELQMNRAIRAEAEVERLAKLLSEACDALALSEYDSNKANDILERAFPRKTDDGTQPARTQVVA